MGLFEAFRNTGVTFNKGSNNNRAMTPGRVAMGKSTFKGTEAEHFVVKLEKRVWEKARMLFAVDLKLSRDPSDDQKEELLKEKRDLRQELSTWMDTLEENSSNGRFQKFMERLDQEDSHRRNKCNLEAA